MFQLFETIRINNGVAENLSYHQARVEQCADINLIQIINCQTLPSKGIHKFRFTYNTDGQISNISITPYTPKNISSLKLVNCDSIYYALKSENRDSLNKLSLLKENCDDILIIKNGFITDTSFANIIFFDGSYWFTPSTPLLKGTARARLLEQNIIKEKEIKISDLQNFSKYMIINAMLPFDLNRAQSISSLY